MTLRQKAWILISILAALLAAVALYGCSTAGDVHTQAIVDAWKRISADGTISPDEATWFAGVLSRELSTGGGINWLATLGSVAGSLLTGAIGLRVYHNQVVAPNLAAALTADGSDPKSVAP